MSLINLELDLIMARIAVLLELIVQFGLKMQLNDRRNVRLCFMGYKLKNYFMLEIGLVKNHFFM